MLSSKLHNGFSAGKKIKIVFYIGRGRRSILSLSSLNAFVTVSISVAIRERVYLGQHEHHKRSLLERGIELLLVSILDSFLA
jgi:hypothetical protein